MRRIPELHAARGLVALSIVIYHLWMPKLFHGWTRVDFFFVLSGYLLTVRFLNRGPDARGFVGEVAVRRVGRIGPAYLAALAALLAYRVMTPSRFPLDGLPYYLTFTQNLPAWWNGVVPPFSPRFFHTWSLALDVQFYLLWCVLLSWGGRRLILPAAVAMIVVAVAGRALGVSEHILPGRCDGFGAGAILAVALGEPAGAGRRAVAARPVLRSLVVAGAVLVAAGMVREWPRLADRLVPWPALSILGTVLIHVGLLGLLVGASGGPATRWLRARPLGHLGTISYGLYLYHLPVFAIGEQVARQLGLGRGWAFDLAVLAASLAAAALSWRFLERPLARRKGRVATATPTAPTGPRPWRQQPALP